MAKVIREKKDLKDLALFYCSKRETSRAKLGAYLTRKCRAQKVDGAEWIESILDDLERLKVVDDHRYSGILVRDLERRGKGKRYIEQKLKEKGIKEEARAFDTLPDDERIRAQELVEKTLKKLLNREKKELKELDRETQYKLKQKILQRLVTAGFSFGMSKEVLEAALKI